MVLLEIPRTKDDWERWSFHHRSSHDAIRQAIVRANGPNLPEYQLYPINLERFVDFLQANQQTHLDMDSTLRAQSVDLQDVDIRQENQLTSWIWLHYLEHQTAETILNI